MKYRIKEVITARGVKTFRTQKLYLAATFFFFKQKYEWRDFNVFPTRVPKHRLTSFPKCKFDTYDEAIESLYKDLINNLPDMVKMHYIDSNIKDPRYFE